MMKTARIAAAALIGAACGGGALAAEGSGLQDWWQAYLSAPHLTTHDGRRLRFFCMGSGAPAVVFEGGLGASGMVFRYVQPEIAKTTRACVYDRAGYGGSDEAHDARDLKAISADLEVVVKAAGHGQPIVLAGHSMGGPITRYFAATHRKQIAGLVLIDPSGDDQRRRFEDAVPGTSHGDDESLAKSRRCIALLEKGPLTQGTADYKDCVGAEPDDAPAALKARNLNQVALVHTRTSLAELENLEAGAANAREGAAVRKSLGDIPLIVLTRGKDVTRAGFTPAQNAAHTNVWRQMHWEDAQLSSHGRRIFVEGSGHSIQHDKPEAVIAAVDEVVAEVRSSRP
jgi:pimeloyl-ACP methyl ester carboxylesterase